MLFISTDVVVFHSGAKHRKSAHCVGPATYLNIHKGTVCKVCQVYVLHNTQNIAHMRAHAHTHTHTHTPPILFTLVSLCVLFVAGVRDWKGQYWCAYQCHSI